MADPAHLEVLRKGVSHWNKWRKENAEVLPDLTSAELQESFLSGIDFREANLSCAVLLGADMSDADLRSCDLSGADLRYVNLNGTKLSGANLTDASGVDERINRLTRVREKRAQRAVSSLLLVLLGIVGYVGYPQSTDGLPTKPQVEEEQVAQLGDEVPRDEGVFNDFLAAQQLTRSAVSAVSLREEMLTLELESRHVSQVDYLVAIHSLCSSVSRQLGESLDPEWSQVYVLNAAGDQGWALDSPQICADVARLDTIGADGLILDNSRQME